jgi:hypothetical protein
LAIGALEHADFNARCFRSHDGWYAIVINYGLFIYLNTYFKLQAAIRDPKVVVYCDRGIVKSLKAADYHNYFDHFVNEYRLHGFSSGPKIKLDGGTSVIHGLLLLTGELLVLGHELGHFLNGDLENEDTLRRDDRLLNGRMLVQDSHREMEARADITGYGIVREALKPRLPDYGRDAFIFGTLLDVMDAMYFVTLDRQTLHPTSIERAIRIAKHFYGEKIADLVAQSFEQPAVIKQVIAELTRATWDQKGVAGRTPKRKK